jgi:hypothetical protein
MKQFTKIPGEEWKPILAPFEEYSVSNWGRVLIVKRGRLASILRHPAGYLQVSLRKTGTSERRLFYVHRLVALAFVPGDTSLEVNHKDMDKTHNVPENLEWTTHAWNVREGMAKSPDWRERLARAGAKRRRAVVGIDVNEVETTWGSLAEAGRAIGGDAGNIHHAIALGTCVYGYRWRYAV